MQTRVFDLVHKFRGCRVMATRNGCTRPAVANCAAGPDNRRTLFLWRCFMSDALPLWAQDMRDLFRSGSIAQFILYGNIFDLVPAPSAKGTVAGAGGTGQGGGRLVPLKQFLEEVMFAQYDVVLKYDR